MHWLNLIGYFWGGVFLANAFPHLVSGMTGRAFQSPFAKPSGEGLSSATVNVLWGFANLVIGYWLVCQVGDFSIKSVLDSGVLALGALLISLFSAHHFGRFHGGRLSAGKPQ